MPNSNYLSSRDYAHPHRPIWMRLLNGVGRGLETIGIRSRLDADDILDRARRKSELDRFDDDALLDRLAVYVDSLEREAALTPMGRMMTRAHLVAVLVTRLRTQAWIESHPDIFTAPLPRMIIVTGLARSGTTLLQRMLAELPGARPLPTWEAYEPIPEPGWQRFDDPLKDPRVARCRRAVKAIEVISPDFFVTHPMDALAPEEEGLVMENSLLGWIPEDTYHVPTYAEWNARQDQTPAYTFLKKALQHLTWQRPGQFWVLKAPHHIGSLDVLFSVFPQATVIHTHRDPLQTVPSFCSLIAHGRAVMSDHIDPLVVGRIWPDKLARMLDHAMAVRAARNDAGILDVEYRELIRAPIAVMARLCDQLGLPWNDSIREHIERWLADNAQHKHGRHRYHAADFGIDEDALRERFTVYRERFALA